MILTCPQCQSQYNLDPGKLGANGKTVRCISCSHTWLQSAEPQQQPVPDSPPPVSIQEVLAATLNKDEAVFDAILSGVGAQEEVKAKEAAAAVRVAGHELSPPVITHNPLGVGAGAFGGLTFFLCVFSTLLLVFIAQKPVVRHWPQMALFYQTIGFHLQAPGEGLRISEMVAEQRIGNQGMVLAVSGKMTNMSEDEITYPPLQVALKNKQGALIKEWKLESRATRLGSGETVPVMLQLPDAPWQGTAVEMRVRDE